MPFESFESCIANQSLYAGLSRKRKAEERKDKNSNLYIKQLLLHNKYTPSAITSEKIEKYKQTKII